MSKTTVRRPKNKNGRILAESNGWLTAVNIVSADPQSNHTVVTEVGKKKHQFIFHNSKTKKLFTNVADATKWVRSFLVIDKSDTGLDNLKKLAQKNVRAKQSHTFYTKVNSKLLYELITELQVSRIKL